MRSRRIRVLPKARELAQRLADGPTWAIRWSKLAVNKWLKQQANLIMDAGLAYEAVTLMSKDHQEAVKAITETRKPNYARATKYGWLTSPPPPSHDSPHHPPSRSTTN